jgi:hypothetical protein
MLALSPATFIQPGTGGNTNVSVNADWNIDILP